MTNVVITDFLNDDQIELAKSVYKQFKPYPAEEICKRIIQPNIDEINRKLNTKNDPMYLAYLVEHVFNLIG